ncbi:BsuPI-related putative proteinase inhibitor [Bacillus sinesaloumensis]|uniref:BsuPI-related putative proteinase inhibitor n=1 Tax=Litchfieldia sinesaloumensis TaxID=1926280 RepID=UPI001356414C|nr:BsuPI-related putative proteinase inhibitor [Bacillus sinesaloumensis]
MKRILLYIIGGLALVSVILIIGQDKKIDKTVKNVESIKEEEEVDLRDNRKKIGKISSSQKKIVGLDKIETSISKTETDQGISITFEIHNAGDEDLRLQFTSSQEYDYEIYNEAGELVYRYSDEHVFAQVIRNVLFAKGKTLTFVAGLPQLEKGEYKVIFWVAARELNHLKEELTFTVD